LGVSDRRGPGRHSDALQGLARGSGGSARDARDELTGARRDERLLALAHRERGDA